MQKYKHLTAQLFRRKLLIVMMTIIWKSNYGKFGVEGSSNGMIKFVLRNLLLAKSVGECKGIVVKEFTMCVEIVLSDDGTS